MAHKEYVVDENIARKKILIVDDDDRYRGALKRKLSLHGYESILLADSPRPVPGLLASEAVDILLLDIYMKDDEKKTGLELLRDIRKNDRQTPVIMVSGDDTPETFVEAMAAGADDYWLKGRHLHIAMELNLFFSRPLRNAEEKWTPNGILSLGYLRTLNISETEKLLLQRYAEEIESNTACSLIFPLFAEHRPELKIVCRIFNKLTKGRWMTGKSSA